MIPDPVIDSTPRRARVGIMGKTGAGKSALCNALLGQAVAAVSAVKACTLEPQDIDLALNHSKGITLIDMPGLGEDDERDAEYGYLYEQMLPEFDLVLWVIKADDRALALDLHWHDTVIQPYCTQHGIPLLFVISQTDKIEPLQWDARHNRPGPEQGHNLQCKLHRVAGLFDLRPSGLCAVSATQNHGLTDLVAKILHALPADKKGGVTHDAKPQHVSPAHVEAERGLRDPVKTGVVGRMKEGAAFVLG